MTIYVYIYVNIECAVGNLITARLHFMNALAQFKTRTMQD